MLRYVCIVALLGSSCRQESTDIDATIVPQGADNGAACTADADCLSIHCVDSTCCNLQCDEQCNACFATQTGLPDGECGPIPEGEACDDGDASSLGDACDGSGGCAGVIPPLEIMPATLTMGAGAHWQFAALGGVPSYTFSVVAGDGQISSVGLYDAPAIAGAGTVQVEDSVGETAFSLVTVEAPSRSYLNMCDLPDAATSLPTGGIYDSGGATSDYTNGENCTLWIQAPPQMVITLTPNMYDVETGCDCDWLEVYDGLDDSGTPRGHFVGTEFEANGPLVATSGNMFIKWHSDNGALGPGYDLAWTVDNGGQLGFVTDPRIVEVSGIVSLTAVDGVGPYAFTVLDGSGAIGPGVGGVTTRTFTAYDVATIATVQVVDAAGATASDVFPVTAHHTMCVELSSTDSVGRLFDSGGPTANYSDGEDCTFLIDPPGTNALTLHAYGFINELGCNCDSLAVYDGTDATGVLLGTYINNVVFELGAPLTASTGAFYLIWHSDNGANRAGYDLVWQ